MADEFPDIGHKILQMRQVARITVEYGAPQCLGLWSWGNL